MGNGFRLSESMRLAISNRLITGLSVKTGGSSSIFGVPLEIAPFCVEELFVVVVVVVVWELAELGSA